MNQKFKKLVVFLSTLIVLFPLFIAGCATTPPKDISNLCEIFYEKDDWYDAAADARDKWGVPIHVPMAMMYQESSFRHDALPPDLLLLDTLDMQICCCFACHIDLAILVPENCALQPLSLFFVKRVLRFALFV